MGWDGSSRAALATSHRRAAVAVRYRVQYLEKGCSVELEMLPNCSARARYAFQSSPAADHLVVHNTTELFASLPLGAATLQGELLGDRVLRTDYMLSGIDALPIGAEFGAEDLIGSGCERATHIVSRVYLGGFARSVGNRSSVEAAAGFFGVKAGGSSASDLASLVTEGNAEDCAAAQKDGQLRTGCSTPLGIGLVPLAGVELEVCDGESAVGRVATEGTRLAAISLACSTRIRTRPML